MCGRSIPPTRQLAAMAALPPPPRLRAWLLALVLGAALFGTHALTPGVSRQAIEFPEDLVLLREDGEPDFAEHAVKTCTINREKGFSLRTPGFADGMQAVNFVKAPASWINASAVVWPVQSHLEFWREWPCVVGVGVG